MRRRSLVSFTEEEVRELRAEADALALPLATYLHSLVVANPMRASRGKAK